ncbi:hypothetical protein WKH56_08800 [Priestia sp. SB1]|uniref:Uncharacterized protein n=1 Tax=Priestia aryabhattai TaxID=412384 RepID=A0AAX6NE79_PRIAR|nr:hypothetical protein [Priestia aryabhattai]MDU9693960.1 hypothetical protein [Priestia aryabhattai]NGY88741.1 hypothetical protein [Priestia megaterium]
MNNRQAVAYFLTAAKTKGLNNSIIEEIADEMFSLFDSTNKEEIEYAGSKYYKKLKNEEAGFMKRFIQEVIDKDDQQKAESIVSEALETGEFTESVATVMKYYELPEGILEELENKFCTRV